MCDLRDYIYKKNPGDEVMLGIVRGNSKLDIQIKLGKK